jgi:pyruvate/2-oxoglutarate dehydrogenase complex dihydrolipoamide acyltransferase (E2) component
MRLAKFPGICRGCGQPIAVGDLIQWTPAGGARHPRCATAAPTPPSPVTTPQSRAAAAKASEAFNRRWAAVKNEYAQNEIAADQAAEERKMAWEEAHCGRR